MPLSSARAKSMASEPGERPQITVTVVYSAAPRTVQELAMQVPSGCLVADALAQAAPRLGMSAAQLRGLEVGVWGKKVVLQHALQDADRLELYRPLAVDPKVARRERFVRQGAKSAGLFATRRANSKAGY